MRRVAIWSAAFMVIAAANAHAQNQGRQEDYQKALQQKLTSKVDTMMAANTEKIRRADRWNCEVRMQDSADYPGKVDTEISVTMPIDQFKEFAPVAVLEAVAVPHNFPTGKIYVRETTTRRVGSIDFRAAEPIGNKYRTGKEKAIEDAIAEMSNAITWH